MDGSGFPTMAESEPESTLTSRRFGVPPLDQVSLEWSASREAVGGDDFTVLRKDFQSDKSWSAPARARGMSIISVAALKRIKIP